MQDRTSARFDFDEWAELYRRDPAAFEARRKAVLGLELARAPAEQRERGRAALERYERAAEGLDGEARARLAGAHMALSVQELCGTMGTLSERMPRPARNED